MLIKELRLRNGLQNWVNRTQLIRELNQVPSEAKLAGSYWTLAFLLGEKTSYPKIVRKHGYPLLSLKKMQYFLICLDRIINHFDVEKKDEKHPSRTLEILRLLRFELFNMFNHSFKLDEDSLLETLLKMKRMVLEQVDALMMSQDDAPLISNMIESFCLTVKKEECDEAPTPKESQRCYPNYPSLNKGRISFAQKGMQILMHADNEYHVMESGDLLKTNYRFQTIYVSSSDGTTVDGLLVQKKRGKHKTIVLALVGHFPTEADYLERAFTRFYDLFNTDVIFINPRNYSQHAGVKSKSMDDVVSDIEAFAAYAQKNYKHMVLYGMCGGVPFMTMAAKKMEEKGLSYKIILDRFSDAYSNVVRSSGLEGLGLVSKEAQLNFKHEVETDLHFLKYVPDRGFNLFVSMSLYGVSKIIQACLMYMRLNYSLSDELKSIPPDKRLILQGRSKKIPGKTLPKFTDIVIDPLHDMRRAFKKERHYQRGVLKMVSIRAIAVANVIPHDSHFYLSMIKLSQLMICMLQTIDNEKLKGQEYPAQSDTGNDIHSVKLYYLKTRNEQPIGQFIRAFTLFGNHISKNELKALHKMDVETVHLRLNIKYPEFDVTIDMAERIKEIFDMIYANQAFIFPLAERVAHSHRGDLNELLSECSAFLAKPKQNKAIIEALRPS